MSTDSLALEARLSSPNWICAASGTAAAANAISTTNGVRFISFLVQHVVVQNLISRRIQFFRGDAQRLNRLPSGAFFLNSFLAHGAVFDGDRKHQDRGGRERGGRPQTPEPRLKRFPALRPRGLRLMNNAFGEALGRILTPQSASNLIFQILVHIEISP